MNVVDLQLVQDRKRKVKKPKNVDGVKYFTRNEIRMLRKIVREKAEADLSANRKLGIREWMVVDLLTSTGLRVSECSNLQIRDLKVNYGQSEIFVRNGKGNVSGTIQIPSGLKKHLKAFLRWKKLMGEDVGDESYLLIGERGKMTFRAIQEIVKKYLKLLGIYEPGKSVHALRHSYAVQLYSKNQDILAIKKQLRHRSIQSTMIYADISKDELQQQVKELWN